MRWRKVRQSEPEIKADKNALIHFQLKDEEYLGRYLFLTEYGTVMLLPLASTSQEVSDEKEEMQTFDIGIGWLMM
jgi:hypothetical protein